MIIDAGLTFSGTVSGNTWTGQTVTGTNTSVISTNVLDTNPATGGNSGNQPIDIGAGEELDVAFAVGTAFAGLTSLECQIVTADDAAISTNVQVITSSGAIPLAQLTAGKQFSVCVDRSAPYTVRRYLAVRYVIVGAGSAGTMIANMVKDYADAQNQYYRSGFVTA